MRGSINAIHKSNCFISVPAKVASSLIGGSNVFWVVAENLPLPLAVSWDGSTSTNSSDTASASGDDSGDVFDLSRSFCASVGLIHGQLVTLQRVDPTAIVAASRVYVEPASEDDWEMLLHNASYFETHMLSQVKVVQSGRTLPLWIRNATVCVVNVTQMEPPSADPNAVYLLDVDTEVAVAPKVRQQANAAAAAAAGAQQKSTCLRTLYPVMSESRCVLVNERDFVNPLVLLNNKTVANCKPSGNVPVGCVQVCEGILLGARLRPLTKVIMRSLPDITRPEAACRGVRLCPLQHFGSNSSLKTQFTEWLSSHSEEVIDSTTVLQYCGVFVKVIVEPPLEQREFLYASSLSDVPVVVDSKSESLESYPDVSVPDAEAFRGRVKEYNQLEQTIMFGLNFPSFLPHATSCFGGLTLLIGSSGVGKSILSNYLRLQLGAFPRLYYSETIQGASLATERLARVKETIELAVERAIANQPAFIVLDSLHSLIPSDGSDGENSSLRSQQIATFLQGAIRAIQPPKHRVMLLGLSPNVESVNPIIMDGSCCGAVVEMKAPDAQQRSIMLGVDVDNAMIKSTEGYVEFDLLQLLERARHFEGDLAQAQKGFTPLTLKGVELHHSAVDWDDIGGLRGVKDTLLETLLWPTKYSQLFKESPLKMRSGLLLYGPSGCGKTILASAVASRCDLNFISIKGPELLSKYIGASEQAVRDVFDRADAAKPCLLFFDEFEALAPRRGHDTTGVTDRVVNQLLTQLDGVESRTGVYVLGASSRPDLIDPALLRPGRLDKMVFVGFPGEEDRSDILSVILKKFHVEDDPSILPMLVAQTVENSGADLQALVLNAQLLAAHEVLDRSRAQLSKKGHSDLPAAAAAAAVASPLNAIVFRGNGSAVSVAQSQTQKAIARQILNSIDLAATSDEKQQQENEEPLITADHFRRALLDHKPSMGPDERRRFDRIYSKFQEKDRQPEKLPNGDHQMKQTLG